MTEHLNKKITLLAMAGLLPGLLLSGQNPVLVPLPKRPIHILWRSVGDRPAIQLNLGGTIGVFGIATERQHSFVTSAFARRAKITADATQNIFLPNWNRPLTSLSFAIDDTVTKTSNLDGFVGLDALKDYSIAFDQQRSELILFEATTPTKDQIDFLRDELDESNSKPTITVQLKRVDTGGMAVQAENGMLAPLSTDQEGSLATNGRRGAKLGNAYRRLDISLGDFKLDIIPLSEVGLPLSAIPARWEILDPSRLTLTFPKPTPEEFQTFLLSRATGFPVNVNAQTLSLGRIMTSSPNAVNLKRMEGTKILSMNGLPSSVIIAQLRGNWQERAWLLTSFRVAQKRSFPVQLATAFSSANAIPTGSQASFLEVQAPLP